MTAYLISLALIGFVAIAVRGAPVRVEIIQFIPRPGCQDAATDFPGIAFLSATQDATVAHVQAAADNLLNRRG